MMQNERVQSGYDLEGKGISADPEKRGSSALSSTVLGQSKIAHNDCQNNKQETAVSRPVSMLSQRTPSLVPSEMPNTSRISTDAEGYVYPEGGLAAWLCVLGSFCGMMSALGPSNTFGIIQNYISENQLRDSSESEVGWIFSLYAFLLFVCGVQIGPIFDAKGPRWLVACGSGLILAQWFALGSCTEYWHFVLALSVCGGLGGSLVFTPSIAAVGHYFLRQRGTWTGLAAAGGSMGGVVYPLVLQALFPRIGFGWATRVIGFINVFLLVLANLFIRSRLPPRKATKESILPDFKIFRDPTYALATLGIFFVEWALFIPLTFLTSYAISVGVDRAFAYQVLAVLNAASCFGRWFPGMIADRLGRFNTMIVTVTICTLTALAIWLPAGGSVAAIIVYAVVFGFASGSGISLTPVCIGQLCKVEDYGRYYATCYTIVSVACLTGLPIAGALVEVGDGKYWALIVFTGCSYAASTITFLLARTLRVGSNPRKIF